MTAATGWSTTTPVHFKIYSVSVTNTLVAGTETIWKATLSGTTLSNMQLKSGTEPTGGYAIGDVIQPMYTHAQHDDTYSAMAQEHDVDGTHKDITPDSIVNAGTLAQTGVASFASHIDVNDSSTAVRDSSDNELLKFSKTSSAVNELTVKNAATGNAPQLVATGDDTDVGLDVSPKGAGQLTLNAKRATRYVPVIPAVQLVDTDPTGTGSNSVDITSNTSALAFAADLNVGIASATTVGRSVFVRATGSGAANDNLTIASAVQATTGNPKNWNQVTVPLDTSQSFDWLVSNADVNALTIVLRGYWEYVS